jgi:hypothetical protein
VPITEVHPQHTTHDEEHLVRIGMMMLVELALQPHQTNVMTVD